MRDSTAILELLEAVPDQETSELPPLPIDITLMAGDFALIEVRSRVRAAQFADLCCGLLPVMRGNVRFLGRDWALESAERAAALRGQVGRVHEIGAWIGFVGADLNILLPQLHHSRRPVAALRDAAAELARTFGLPGVPLVRPGALTPADRARAACVRAFLGDPRLVLLESPVQAQFVDLIPPLLNALAAARDKGAAVIWLTRSDLIWRDRSFPATCRLRLTEYGLMPVRHAA
ncbi:MAG: ABC transporter ATP-binding protein [Acetobacteraceae bacterium]|nr:ABC transporter ATP-binding protein [Acetobacteraceae bacterium]